MVNKKHGIKHAKDLIRKCRRQKSHYLDLGKCGIRDLNELPQLFECKHLKILNLGFWLWDGNKSQGSKNYGEHNLLQSIPAEIAQLSQLKVLGLRGPAYHGWGISDLSFLKGLNSLKSLDVSNNNITDISALESLTSLENLNLAENNIRNIQVLRHMRKLKVLLADQNNIVDIEALAHLNVLKQLSLGNNNIDDFTVLSQLQSLTKLNLSNTGLTELDCIGELENLRELNLKSNTITDIAPLSEHRNIEVLQLSNNKLTTLAPLSDLVNAKEIDLRHNEITEVPQAYFNPGLWVNFHGYSGTGLRLYGNPIESPPIEVLRQGRRAVLDWFEAQKQELKEIKVILIGEPKAGKTSLLRRLKDNSFDKDEKQTDGVNIEDITFGETKTFQSYEDIKDITGHFWDFGGQEIMTSTHQFFLTSRSVYILVLDARKDLHVSQEIRKWLKRIKSTGGDSSVIVVANQIDVNPGFGIENVYELQRDYPQIKAFIRASCATTEGLDQIKATIAELIPKAELFGSEIDERWLNIKDRLVEHTKEKFFLNENQFIEICEACDLERERQQQNAIHFLHDLGLVLHFDQVRTSDYFVLDPYWITYGVYQILTSTRAGDLKGEVALDELDYIVNEEQDKIRSYRPASYRKIRYTKNQRRFLVDILHQFKLCFKIENGAKFIIPDLLDTSEPYEHTRPIREAADSIRFDYLYDYLPKSIMPNIMVDTHQIIEHKWRTGMVLKWNGCKAMVSIYEPRISIVVTGEFKKKREFMAAIRSRIDTINQSLANPPEMQLPLPGTNDYVDYEEILWLEQEGESHYKTRKYKFAVAELLDGMPTLEEVRCKSDFAHTILLKNQHKIMAQNEKIWDRLCDMPLSIELDAAIAAGTQSQIKVVETELEELLARFEPAFDDRAHQLYAELNKTDKFQAKVKYAIPILHQLGLQVELEFDLKNWASEMYQKHQVKIFDLMTDLQRLA